MIGHLELAEDPRFRTPEARRHSEHRDAFEAYLLPWLADRTKRECQAEGQAAGVYCGAVYTPADVVNDPHFQERAYFQPVDHPETGAVAYPGAPYRFSESPWRIARPAPRLGEHNFEVYGGRFGYTRRELSMLYTEGLI